MNIIGCLALGTLAVAAYCVGLDRNGLGNPFYAAAVQAGTHSLHNAFFAAIDLSGTMSVDKPPLSLWLMELSVRIFGFNPLGELLPDALAGVATTAVVVAIVREWTSLRWGLFAGLLSLASPMANVMFRFNNPDALLTLLTIGTVWCFTSALRRPRAWKLLAAGALIAMSVLTKLLVGVVIVPVLVLAYALWAPTSLRARVRDLALLAATAVVGSGWYFVVVANTRPALRPWIDGSYDNNPFSLLLSSNVKRLVGRVRRQPSPPGLFRLFHREELANYGPLIVLALLTFAAAVTVWHKRRREAPTACLITACGLSVCVVMSFVQASYHTYYAVVSTPLLAAGISMSLADIWRSASTVWRAGMLAMIILGITGCDIWVWSQYSSNTAFEIVLGAICAVGLLALIRWPKAGLSAVLVIAVTLPGYYTWLSWRDHHTGGSPLGGPLGAQVAWDQNPPEPNSFNYPSRVSADLRSLLQHAGPFEFAVAMQRDEEAGSIQLATGVNVLPLTGWVVTPVGMMDRFERLVRQGAVHYFLPTGGRTPILRWVVTHFASFQVGDQMVYDLTRPTIPVPVGRSASCSARLVARVIRCRIAGLVGDVVSGPRVLDLPLGVG